MRSPSGWRPGHLPGSIVGAWNTSGCGLRHPAGGHFPSADPVEARPAAALYSEPEALRNHPSFEQCAEDGSQPALDELVGLVNEGFGRLYATRADAEAALGGRCYPAPWVTW